MDPTVVAAIAGALVGGVVGAISGGLVARYTYDLQRKRDEELRQQKGSDELRKKLLEYEDPDTLQRRLQKMRERGSFLHYPHYRLVALLVTFLVSLIILIAILGVIILLEN